MTINITCVCALIEREIVLDLLAPNNPVILPRITAGQLTVIPCLFIMLIGKAMH